MTVLQSNKRRTAMGLPLALAFAAFAIVLVGISLALPARVPLHWDEAGKPDSFGSPAQFALAFAAPALVLFVAFFFVAWLARSGPIGALNVPNPRYWKAPVNEQRLRMMVVQDLNHIFTGAVLLVTVLVVGAAASAADGSGRLSWIIPTGIGMFLVGMVAYVVWVFARRYRTPAWHDEALQHEAS
jgi:uncharacterized membrane protein